MRPCGTRYLFRTDPDSFAGHTLGELVEAFGSGYTVADFGVDGPYSGLHYEDGRTEHLFFFEDPCTNAQGWQSLYSDFIIANTDVYSTAEKRLTIERILWQFAWM